MRPPGVLAELERWLAAPPSPTTSTRTTTLAAPRTTRRGRRRARQRRRDRSARRARCLARAGSTADDWTGRVAARRAPARPLFASLAGPRSPSWRRPATTRRIDGTLVRAATPATRCSWSSPARSLARRSGDPCAAFRSGQRRRRAGAAHPAPRARRTSSPTAPRKCSSIDRASFQAASSRRAPELVLGLAARSPVGSPRRAPDVL